MIRILLTLALCLIGSFAVAQDKKAQPANASDAKPGEHASYQIGFDTGRQLKSAGLLEADVIQKDFLLGLLDALQGGAHKLTQAEIQLAMKGLAEKIKSRALTRSMAFLETNKKKQGITSLPSGLQYEVIKSGNGAMPTLKNTVLAHYEGKLINGQVFDSSIARGEPTSFRVDGVIQGWTEALSRMKVGDKWRLFIPPTLAYGENGAPPNIGPNEALIFEVELLQIQ